MKYVMFEVTVAGVRRLLPVIFPDALVHKDVAEALYPIVKGLPVRAGEVSIEASSTHGSSTTLKMSADEEDALVISNYDYLHGVIG